MLGNINHPGKLIWINYILFKLVILIFCIKFKGRATHISQTWSQFANTERHSSLVNSPMAALNSSPLARNQSIPSTSSIGTFYASNQLVSPSLKSINLMSSIQNENEAGLLTKNENDDVFRSPTTPTKENQSPGMNFTIEKLKIF